MEMENNSTPLPDTALSSDIYKILLTHPAKEPQTPHPYTRAEIQRSGDKFQLSLYTSKQVFHSNFTAGQLKPTLGGLFGTTFRQYHAWDPEYEYSAKISKKGKVLSSRRKASSPPRPANFNPGSFDRQKNHIIEEGEDIPALRDMGVFTQEGKIAAGMHDKFNQINRFLELLADETGPGAIPPGTGVNIVDFGCGKSYLTFLVYHYFTKTRRLQASICGLDLDPGVVETCTAAAKKYGCKNLTFLQGDIGQQTAPPIENWGRPGTFNIVISLHACDTATDHALYTAIKWNADLICAAPCCQHQLKQQMKPKSLALFDRYGIIKERVAALATDAIRANLLECCGYKTQIIEFVDMEHTPKNLLIRAKKRPGKGSQAHQGEVERAMHEFGFEPMLMTLLQEGGYL